MNNSLLNLTLMQFREFIREPAIVFWALIFPLATAYVLGMAFHENRVQSFKVAYTGTAEFPALERDSLLTDKVKFEIIQTGRAEAEDLLKKGHIKLFISEDKGGFTAHFDPADSEAARLFLLIDKQTRKVDSLLKAEALEAGGFRYIDFLIPGLIAFGIMNSCLWGIGYSLIEFRMKKLLRRMVAAPMKKWEFMASHLIARLTLSGVESFLLAGFAYLLFDVTVSGSIIAFMILFIAGNLLFAGIAMLIASRANTTRSGNGLVNLVTLPMMVLSGIFFSYRNFPDEVVPIIEYLPLTVLTDAIRAVFNQAAGIADILPAAGGLFAVGLLLFALGIKLFRWN